MLIYFKDEIIFAKVITIDFFAIIGHNNIDREMAMKPDVDWKSRMQENRMYGLR